MKRVALVVSLLFCMVSPALAQSEPGPMDRAYAAIANHQYDVARPLIESYLQTHPDDAQAWHQLAYTDEALKDYTAALTALERYLTLAPSDERAKLERAYDLQDAGQPAAATAQFAALRTSPDQAVADQATREWQARQVTRQSWELFGYDLNESRFADNFYGFDLRKTFTATPIQPYAVLHVVGDTRSSGPGQNAQIFSDNAAVVDAGLRAHVAPGTYLFAEGGVGIGTRGEGTISDLRYGLASSQQWGRFPSGLSLDASLAYYSRYAGNTIGYINVLKAVQLHGPVSFVFGIEGALDAQRLYYNNYINEVGGLQFGTPWVKVRIEGYAGQYLARGSNQPANTTYSSFRPEILFGTSF